MGETPTEQEVAEAIQVLVNADIFTGDPAAWFENFLLWSEDEYREWLRTGNIPDE